MATFAEIKAETVKLSPWVHLATVGADGAPDVVPVHPAWDGDTIWAMIYSDSVKARNIRHQPQVAVSWQIDERGDGVEIWGAAALHDDVETKRRLWNGVFDYDLTAFAPGGPEGSPNVIFLAITPERAVFVKQFGAGGVERWPGDAA